MNKRQRKKHKRNSGKTKASIKAKKRNQHPTLEEALAFEQWAFDQKSPPSILGFPLFPKLSKIPPSA